MNIQTVILLLILASVGVAIFLIIKQKTNKDETKGHSGLLNCMSTTRL